MKRLIPKISLALLLVAGIGYLALYTDKYTEVNAMTGAIRTRMRYACIFNTAWKIRPTWISESAARQVIPTEDGWRYLSVVSKTVFSTTHACGRAPASYPLNAIHPESLNLTTEAEIDHFARDFIMADEAKRRQMISLP